MGTSKRALSFSDVLVGVNGAYETLTCNEKKRIEKLDQILKIFFANIKINFKKSLNCNILRLVYFDEVDKKSRTISCTLSNIQIDYYELRMVITNNRISLKQKHFDRFRVGLSITHGSASNLSFCVANVKSDLCCRSCITTEKRQVINFIFSPR